MVILALVNADPLPLGTLPWTDFYGFAECSPNLITNSNESLLVDEFPCHTRWLQQRIREMKRARRYMLGKQEMRMDSKTGSMMGIFWCRVKRALVG